MPINIFLPPEYIALFDAVIAVDKVLTQYDPWFDGLDDCIDRLGNKLSGGELQAYGVIVSNGDIREIPIETWRMPYSRIFLDLRRPYQVKFADGSIVKDVFVIVKREDLMELFDVNNSLEGYFENIELGESDLHKHSTVSYDFPSEHVSSKQAKPNKASKKLSKAALRKWFIEEYIPANAGSITTPNREIAWKDAVAQFPDFSIPRDTLFRPIYDDLVPPEWQAINKPKRKG